MGTRNPSDNKPLETAGDLTLRHAANDVGDYAQLFGAVLAAVLLIASATNARERISGVIIVLISAAICNVIVYLYRHHDRRWTRRMVIQVVVIGVALVGSIVTVATLQSRISASPAPTVVPTHYTGPVEISPGYGVDVDDPGNDIKRDLLMPDRVTLQAINNSSITLLPGRAPVAYDTCRDLPIGADVKVVDLQVDRQLCVITAEGRQGMLKVTKASTAEDPAIIFSAVVWSK